MEFHFTLQTLFLILIIASTISIGLLVLFKNPRSLVNKTFAIFLLGITLISFGFLFLSFHAPFNLYDKLIHYGGLCTLLGQYLFAQVFPNKEHFKRWNTLSLIPFAFFALVIPFNVFIRQSSFDTSGTLITTNGPLLLPYAIFWIGYFIFSIVQIIRTYMRTHGRQRMQMQYLFAGIIVFFLCLFTFDLLLPLLGNSMLFVVGPLSSIVLVGATAYAIIVHELLDIRIILQRGIIYTVLFLCVIGLYTGLLGVGGYLLEKATNMEAIVCAGITMLVGVFAVRPLENYFRKVTDPIFFKNQYDYADALQKLSNVLRSNVHPKDIVQASSNVLHSILKPHSVAFILEANTAPYEVDSNELSIPVMFDEQTVGKIILGQKRSGESYSSKDKQLLETFAVQAAVALEKGRLYEKVQEYNTHLEQLVDERTDEIKKLQEDQKQAMIDISHNLQTPLAVINGELELLGDSETGKIDAVRKSIDRVSGFIRQLLHLARLDHSVYTIELFPMNLSSMLEDQAEYFSVMAQEKKVRVISRIAPSVKILGQKRLLGELVTNLVVNAINCRSSKRKGVIEIALSSTSTDAVITVKDNGIGISPEDLPELFTRFYKSARKGALHSGTGLGLAICKKIVEKHNGMITCTSTLGVETLFTITIPLMSKK